MKQSHAVAPSVTLVLLSACAGGTGALRGPVSVESLPSVTSRHSAALAPALTQLMNLDYSNGSITVFSIQNGRARVTESFAPGNGRAQGLAVDGSGRIYTTLTETNSKPCSACVEVFTDTGGLVERLDAPILEGAPGAPSLTDVALDRHLNVYVSDFGQQAVYFFPHAHKARAPVVVVQNSQNAASVLAAPTGDNVVVSGGCGFASVRPYARTAPGRYIPGSCFGIGTIALIGGAADEKVDVMTPVTAYRIWSRSHRRAVGTRSRRRIGWHPSAASHSAVTLPSRTSRTIVKNVCTLSRGPRTGGSRVGPSS